MGEVTERNGKLPPHNPNITSNKIPPHNPNITSSKLPPHNPNITSNKLPPQNHNITSSSKISNLLGSEDTETGTAEDMAAATNL